MSDKIELRRPGWMYWVAVPLLRFVMFFIARVLGRKNIPKNRAFMMCANHQSWADPPVLYVLLTRVLRPIYFIAKVELTDDEARLADGQEQESFGLNRFLVSQARSILVDRGKYDEADKEAQNKAKRRNIRAIRTAYQVLDVGYVLGVFPEGTRNKTGGEMLPFDPRTVDIAKKRRKPILPIHISWRGIFVRISIGELIYPHPDESKEQLSDRLRTAIEALAPTACEQRVHRMIVGKQIVALLLLVSGYSYLVSEMTPGMEGYEHATLVFVIAALMMSAVNAGDRRRGLLGYEWKDRSSPAGPSSPPVERFTLVDRDRREVVRIERPDLAFCWSVIARGDYVDDSLFQWLAQRKAENALLYNIDGV